MCKIPEEYMWKVINEEDDIRESTGCRDISPVGLELREKKVSEISCPKCGKKHLIVFVEDFTTPKGLEFDLYRVRCEEEGCDWKCPIASVDNGDAVGEFKTWYEAFELMGKPVDKVDENLILYLYPEGPYRDAAQQDYADDLNYDDLFDWEDCE